MVDIIPHPVCRPVHISLSYPQFAQVYTQGFWAVQAVSPPEIRGLCPQSGKNFGVFHSLCRKPCPGTKRQEAVISYDIDEYDERFLRHLALGYTKEMIANLKGMPFGVKSLEKRQNDLIGRLFGECERVGVNATRLVVRALELRILDIDNLEADEE